MLSHHPNSAGRRNRAHFTLYANLGSQRVRVGLVGRGQQGEAELRRFRKPDGLDNYAALVGKAAALNAGVKRAG